MYHAPNSLGSGAPREQFFKESPSPELNSKRYLPITSINSQCFNHNLVPKTWMSIKAAHCTSLIQRGWVKCGRHISVGGIQLYNGLGIPLSHSYHIITLNSSNLIASAKTPALLMIQYYTNWLNDLFTS